MFLIASGASSLANSLSISAMSHAAIISSTDCHPSSDSAAETWSRRFRLDTIRSAKLITFCNLVFWVAHAPPHTHAQYRIRGKTSVSTRNTLSSRGILERNLHSPMRIRLHRCTVKVMWCSHVRAGSSTRPSTFVFVAVTNVWSSK